MVLPGHLAGGYLATHALLSFANIPFSSAEIGVLYAVGIIAAEGPDIDLLFFNLEYRKQKIHIVSNHRDYITHTPILWIAISLVFFVIGLILQSIFISFIGLAILSGSLSHLILDSFDCGIRWLWPISKKRFCLYNIQGPKINERVGTVAFYRKYITSTYLTSPTFYLEILITLIAVFVILN